MFIAFFLPWKLLYDVNAFHICDILLSNPNNIFCWSDKYRHTQWCFQYTTQYLFTQKNKNRKAMIIVQKIIFSQIDTHTRLFFIIKENEKNDRKDFVIYAESKRSKCWSNFENMWFKIYHNILQINERNNQLLRYCSKQWYINKYC